MQPERQPSTDDFIEFVDTIRAQGFICSINTPSSDGEVSPVQQGRRNRASIMIEISKRTFMGVKTFRKTEGFDAVRQVARDVLRAVQTRARERIGG